MSQEAAGQINLLTGVIDNTASHVQLLVDAYNESYAAALTCGSIPSAASRYP